MRVGPYGVGPCGRQLQRHIGFFNPSGEPGEVALTLGSPPADPLPRERMRTATRVFFCRPAKPVRNLLPSQSTAARPEETGIHGFSVLSDVQVHSIISAKGGSCCRRECKVRDRAGVRGLHYASRHTMPYGMPRHCGMPCCAACVVTLPRADTASGFHVHCGPGQFRRAPSQARPSGSWCSSQRSTIGRAGGLPWAPLPSQSMP